MYVVQQLNEHQNNLRIISHCSGKHKIIMSSILSKHEIKDEMSAHWISLVPIVKCENSILFEQ